MADRFLEFEFTNWDLEDIEDTIDGIIGRGGLLSRLKAERRARKSNNASRLHLEVRERGLAREAKFKDSVLEGNTISFFRRGEEESDVRSGKVVSSSPSGKSVYVINPNGDKELVKFTRVLEIVDGTTLPPVEEVEEEVEEIDHEETLESVLAELEEMERVDEEEREAGLEPAVTGI